MRRRCATWLAALALSACGGGGDAGTADSRNADVGQRADVAVLMIGNSHTVGAGLPARLAAALQAALPGRSVFVHAAPGTGFLDEHLGDPTTLALLGARRWQAVVLQAQKYSSSGTVDYPTTAAEELIRRVRNAGAVPLLYPEWARRGVDEAERIWALHAGIAAREPACVAPIPQAWVQALAAGPALPLYSPDGNHADDAGAQLTSLVLMATLTGISPAALGDVAGGGDSGLQATLRGAAAAAMAAQGARSLCPGQPLVR